MSAMSRTTSTRSTTSTTSTHLGTSGNRTLTIRSVPLAAYVAVKGFTPEVRRRGERPEFVVPDRPEVRRAREEWRAYQADADPDQLFSQVAALRAAVSE